MNISPGSGSDDVVVKVMSHEMKAHPKKTEGNNLKLMREGKNLIQQAKDEGIYVHHEGNWLITTKSSPYSDKDMMIVYIGDDTEISNINFFEDKIKANDPISEKDMADFIELTQILTDGIRDRYKNELASGELELITGFNTSLFPGHGKTQSLFRPHFHITLANNKVGTENNVTTDEVKLTRKNKKGFALNRQNKRNIILFSKYLEKVDASLKYEQGFQTKWGNYALDFDLPSSNQLLSTENWDFYRNIHKHAYAFLKKREKFYNKIGRFNYRDQLGFTLSIFEKDGKGKLRIKFSSKRKGEDSGMVETSGRRIHRRNDVSYGLPDTSKHKELVTNILEEATLQEQRVVGNNIVKVEGEHFNESFDNDKEGTREKLEAMERENNTQIIAINGADYSSNIKVYNVSKMAEKDLDVLPVLLEKGTDGVILTGLNQLGKDDRKPFELVLGVADCAAISFASGDGDTIGLVHAGYKGVANGMIKNMVGEVRKIGDLDDFDFYIGPMAGDNFEIETDIVISHIENAIAHHTIDGLHSENYLKKSPNDKGRSYLNLKKLIHDLMGGEGILETKVNFSDNSSTDITNKWPSFRLQTWYNSILINFIDSGYSGGFPHTKGEKEELLGAYHLSLNNDMLDFFLSDNFQHYSKNRRLSMSIAESLTQTKKIN